MSGVNLQAIYDRLASAPKYHPLSANTFADWSMEAGDVVTVSRDGTDYSSPVGTMTMRWTGKQQIQIQSEGSRERDPISRVSARKYATGGGGTSGIRANQSLYYEMIDKDRELRGVISATAEGLTVDYTKRISDKGIELEGKIEASAERLTIDYTKKIDDKGVELEGKIEASAERLTIDYTDKIGNVESAFDQRAGQIELSVSNLDDRLSAQIAVTDRTASMSVGRVKYSNTLHYANKASFPALGRSDTLYYADDTRTAYIYIPEAHFYAKADVDEYGNANYIKAGEIAISINESGEAVAKIDAKKVYIGSLSSEDLDTWAKGADGLIAEKITAKDVRTMTLTAGEIETFLANIGSAVINSIETTYDVDVGRNLNVNSGNANINGDLNLSDSSEIVFEPFEGSGIATSLKTLSINGVEATKFIGTEDVNFKKATSLVATWSGSVLTISGSPAQTPALEKKVAFGTSVSGGVDLTVSHGSASVFENDRGEENKDFLSLPTYIESVGDAASGGNTTRYTTTPAISISRLRETLSATSNGTYTPSDGKVGFSEVSVNVSASVSGSWSGSVYTVTANPGSKKKSIGFDSSADIQLSIYHGSASVFTDTLGNENKDFLSIPTYAESVGDGAGGGNTNRYSTTPAISIASMREALSVTSNGTYTPGTGKVGFSSVVVNVPSSSGGSDASQIQIDSSTWYNSSDPAPAYDANLSNTGRLIAKNKVGYVYFRAYVQDGSGEKWYRIPIDTR